VNEQVTHTPGPWIYEHRSGDHPKNNNGGWGAIGLWGPDGEQIFGTGTGWDSDFVEPSEANARLIAAAPNMLVQLKIVSWVLSDLSPDGLVKAGVDAVIAEAEGTQP